MRTRRRRRCERTDPEQLESLADAGVRGLRAFMLPGGVYAWDELPALAERIAPLGWSLHVQLDGRELDRYAEVLAALEAPVVIDHVGKFLEPVDVDHPSLVALRRLVAKGRCWVKLSAAYETSRAAPPDYADVAALAAVLIVDAPERMLWDSNWPHPNLQPSPDDLDLLAQFFALVPDFATSQPGPGRQPRQAVRLRSADRSRT